MAADSWIGTQGDLKIGMSRYLVFGAWCVTRCAMTEDIFARRVAAIRQRFVAKLDARIGVIASAVLQPDCEDQFDILATAHREAHDLCGIGQTLGFVGTGQVARSIERLLLVALKAERTLTDDESVHLREGITLLRSTAIVEMASAG